MNAKAMGLITVFTSFTIALSQIRIPAPYPPGLFYQLYQIPIVIAFLFLGAKSGVIIAFLNMLASTIISGSATAFLGPPFGFFPWSLTENFLGGIIGIVLILVSIIIYLKDKNSGNRLRI